MYIGEYRHTIDPKKRLSLPAKFRALLGKKVIISRGLEECLFVYTPLQWKKLTESFANLSLGSEDARAFNRFMLAGATEVDVDSAGRILIPEYLKTYAHLTSDITLTGVGSRVELWDTTRWGAYSKQIESKATQYASALSDRGSL